MAKSSKVSFRESVDSYNALSKSIDSRRFAPVYLLMGDEPYFIDQISGKLAQNILSEEEKAFGQIVLYGKDSDVGSVINLCRQMPMMGSFQVVILREAQQMRNIDQLSLYTSSPLASTILVVCHKEKNVDKRLQFYKHCAEKGQVLESVRPRDYEFGGWLSDFVRSKGCNMDTKAIAMLTDHVGADICKISGELEKLITALPEGTKNVTADIIEQNIGISKEFNTFELTKALSERNLHKAMLIADHFARNPKDNPLLLTISSMFTHFQRIFLVNYHRWLSTRATKRVPMPDDMTLARELKLPSPYFLKEYQGAAALYPNNKVFAIIGLLREYDMKSKGINGGSADDGELLKELLLRILTL